jgi:hypothetical protein
VKRSTLARPVLLALTVPTLAAGTMVHNHCGLLIVALFADAPRKKSWDPNLMEGLGEGSLVAGKSHEVAALPDGTYDLRVSAPDEAVLCIMSYVAVRNAAIDLDEAMGKMCKRFDRSVRRRPIVADICDKPGGHYERGETARDPGDTSGPARIPDGDCRETCCSRREPSCSSFHEPSVARDA